MSKSAAAENETACSTCASSAVSLPARPQERRRADKYEKNVPVVYELIMDSSSSFVSPDSGKREVKMKTIIRMKQELIEEDKEGNLKVAMTVLSAEQEVISMYIPVMLTTALA